MRLRLASRFLLLRRLGNTPFAKRALAEAASSSDANCRLLSSFNAAWLLPALQQKLQSPGTYWVPSVCAVGGLLLLKTNFSPVLVFLRTYRSRDRGSRPPEDEQVVTVSAEVWQLLKAYDMLARFRRVYYVQVQTTQPTSNEVQLTLRGPNASKVALMLAGSPRTINLHELVAAWLLAEGPNGIRIMDIRKRSGALVELSKDKKSILVMGPSEATLAAKSIIDECDCIEEFDIDDFIGFYLINNRAFHLKRLSVETDALVTPIPVRGATTWKALVVGPTERVKRLRRKLDGLHVERRAVTHAVRSWLNNPGKGSKDARTLVLDRKFKTRIHLPPLIDDIDPARMVDLVIVAEGEGNVADVFAVIGTWYTPYLRRLRSK